MPNDTPIPTDAIRMANDGKAIYDGVELGSWASDYIAGKPVFKGRLNGDQVWTDWMKKRELRAWFALHAAVG